VSRPKVLQKVRAACATRSVPLPDGFPEAPTYQDRVGVFRRELEAVGGVFLDSRERDPASVLSQVLKQTGHTEIYWEEEKIFTKHGLPYRLRLPESFSTPNLVFSHHFRGRVRPPITLAARTIELDRLAAIPISVSSASYVIAETGSIVQMVGPGRGRLLNVLPETHVVFLAETDLLSNSDQLLQRVRPGEEGSALTLVTGPSRTADIGKVLVKGMHGPRRWFVILTGGVE
jgi:hypothetical protein